MDGVSEHAAKGFDEPVYPIAIDPGVIVIGYEGGMVLDKREPWAFDGSFLVFRWHFPVCRRLLDQSLTHGVASDWTRILSHWLKFSLNGHFKL